MTRNRSIVAVLAIAAGALGAAGWTVRAEAPKPGSPLLVMTGSMSEVRQPRYDLAASQEVFDKLWVEHMGDRVEKAAQGWPLPPQIDFARCEALFIFDGDSMNSNGFRVMDVIEDPDAVIVRVEDYSYQTASFDGRDSGQKVTPWALVVIPATDKTIIIEENVQNLKAGEPQWKQRAAFPGVNGVGRPVPGTGQHGAGG